MINGNLRQSARNEFAQSHKNNDKFKAIRKYYSLDTKKIADAMGVPRSYTDSWNRGKFSFRGGREGEAQGREKRYKIMSNKYYKKFEIALIEVFGITKEQQEEATKWVF